MQVKDHELLDGLIPQCLNTWPRTSHFTSLRLSDGHGRFCKDGWEAGPRSGCWAPYALHWHMVTAQCKW